MTNYTWGIVVVFSWSTICQAKSAIDSDRHATESAESDGLAKHRSPGLDGLARRLAGLLVVHTLFDRSLSIH
ncbi:hypothetical protein ACLI4U_10195 [Natrialbaceae archaeon A-CW2]